VERRVTGVVEDYRSLASPAAPTDAFFVMYDDLPVTVFGQMVILARVHGDPEAITNGLVATIQARLPGIPVHNPVPLTEQVEGLRAEQRLIGRLLWILSLFGALMMAVGLYGVIYFIVSQRRRELGIRRALGADATRILRLLGASASGMVALGSVLGGLVAYALSRVLESRLFEVGALDPLSYLSAAVALAAVAVATCLAPARAALRVDPVATLRQE